MQLDRFHFAGRVLLLATLTLSAPAFAIQTCELDGQSVNPYNGATTAGKTGLMRCKDNSTGVIVREEELRDGKSVGVKRFFKDGLLEREYSVNERGNRDGVSREWNVGKDGQRVLVREETLKDSNTVGVAKSWHPNGQMRRLTFYGDEKREQASVEFTTEGQLYDLRCTMRPVFGKDFDDKAACGHAGKVSVVPLYNGKGQVTSRVSFERGERRKVESLWESGSVRELRETSDASVLERRFAADGTKLHETQWVRVQDRESSSSEVRIRNVKVLDQEFHPSGKLVQETRCKPTERGFSLLASEAQWYLNGQAKARSEYAYEDNDGKRFTRTETRFFDNGKPQFEGRWRAPSADARDYRSELPSGTHKSFDEEGRVRWERVYDERGRITREREFDERGAVVRDDEVFEDGSRKAMSR
jgi:antitoxin component YwqK of YwqJK toxin-antitoxin module